MDALRLGWPEGLTSLCLEWNSIGEEGAVHIAAALAVIFVK